MKRLFSRRRAQKSVVRGGEAQRVMESESFLSAFGFAKDQALAKFRSAEGRDQAWDAHLEWRAALRVENYIRACIADGEDARKMLERDLVAERSTRDSRRELRSYLDKAREAREAAEPMEKTA